MATRCALTLPDPRQYNNNLPAHLQKNYTCLGGIVTSACYSEGHRGCPGLKIGKIVTKMHHSTRIKSSLSEAEGHFPNDDAALKLLYLVLNNVPKNGNGRPGMVQEIVRRFFGERFGIQGETDLPHKFLMGPRSLWWIEREFLDRLLVGRDPNEGFAKYDLFDDLNKPLSEML